MLPSGDIRRLVRKTLTSSLTRISRGHALLRRKSVSRTRDVGSLGHRDKFTHRWDGLGHYIRRRRSHGKLMFGSLYIGIGHSASYALNLQRYRTILLGRSSRCHCGL